MSFQPKSRAIAKHKAAPRAPGRARSGLRPRGPITPSQVKMSARALNRCLGGEFDAVSSPPAEFLHKLRKDVDALNDSCLGFDQRTAERLGNLDAMVSAINTELFQAKATFTDTLEKINKTLKAMKNLILNLEHRIDLLGVQMFGPNDEPEAASSAVAATA